MHAHRLRMDQPSVAAVAKVADLVQEKAKEVAVRRPDGRRPQEIHQAAVGLTTRKRASECSS